MKDIHIKELNLEEKLKHVKNIPRGNEFRLNSIDFPFCNKDDMMIYFPFDKVAGFYKFMQRLNTEIIKPDWESKTIFIEQELWGKTSPPYVETDLHIYYINNKIDSFSEHLSDDSMIREGVIKYSEDVGYYSFGQDDLGIALDTLLIGCNQIARRASDCDHQITLELKRSFGDIIKNRKPTINLYQKGVRSLNISLIPIFKAIDIINGEIEKDERYKLDADDSSKKKYDFAIKKAKERIKLLKSWERENPEPFLTPKNIEPLPEEFQRALEKRHSEWYKYTEKRFTEITKNLGKLAEKLRKK